MPFIGDDNPYAAPQAEDLNREARLDTYHDAWRDGKALVVRREAELLDRCLKCAAPTEGYRDRYSRVVSWHRPIWFILVLISWPLYLIAYFIVRRRTRLTVALCPLHRRKRMRAITVSWLCAIAGIGAMIFAAVISNAVTASESFVGIAFIAGLVLLFAGLIIGAVGGKVLVPKRIDKHFVWLSKVSPDYLATLPDWNAPGDVAL